VAGTSGVKAALGAKRQAQKPEVGDALQQA
jgi:hypothetical protein